MTSGMVLRTLRDVTIESPPVRCVSLALAWARPSRIAQGETDEDLRVCGFGFRSSKQHSDGEPSS